MSGAPNRVGGGFPLILNLEGNVDGPRSRWLLDTSLYVANFILFLSSNTNRTAGLFGKPGSKNSNIDI